MKVHLSAAACVLALIANPVSSADFTVSTRSDSGAGSLRQAITAANANPGPDRILFNIVGPPFDIQPISALPIILDPLEIDATSQPGFTGTPLIVLSGQSVVGTTHGLDLESSNCVVRGLVIQRFRGDGIYISGRGGNWIAGNFIGTTPSGTGVQGNGLSGIEIVASPNNVIGGTNAGDRNVISGNDTGLYITGLNGTNNRVLGNFIGTDVNGTTALGNTNNGVLLYSTRKTLVGGATASARNVISGNNGSGVYLLESLTTGNQIFGNFIGTSATGQTALSNKLDGVTIYNAPANIIGGTAPGAGNVISGNRQAGVAVSQAESINNRIEGNWIGIAADGKLALGNRFAGVTFTNCSLNTVGGTNATTRNVISGNQQSGVLISDARCVGNVISGNFIGTDRFGTNAVANGFSGVTITQGTNNVIGGDSAASRNVISGNTQNGIYLQGGGSNAVAANFIGTDVTGMWAIPNNQYGVRVDSPGNKVGGSIGRDGNLISGNLTGMALAGPAASNNVVSGNVIGLNAAGTAALPNNAIGIYISSAPRNLIGGAEPFNRNVISGNTNSGIYMINAGATGNRIWGNWIGPDVSGTVPIGNTSGGIYIYGCPGNFLGGSTPGTANVISGNWKVGISIGDPGANGNIVQGNYIGLQPNGSLPLGNEWHGVELLASAVNTVIGGTAPGEGNRIGYALTWAYDGVRVRDQATGNVVRGNSIFRNGEPSPTGLAIDLQNDGLTANDPNDADTGANAQQNFPVLTTAAGQYITTLSGTLNSRPNAPFTIDFYGNTFAEPSGFGEAERWLGAISVTTSGNNASFSATFTNLFGAGSFISATATDASGNTSEMCQTLPLVSVDADLDGLPDDYEVAAGISGNPAPTAETDTDGDGVPDRKEFVAGTDPSKSSSVLRINSAVTVDGTIISFPSVSGRLYTVLVSDVITGPWTAVADQLAGTGATLRVADSQPTDRTRFYVVRVSSN